MKYNFLLLPLLITITSCGFAAFERNKCRNEYNIACSVGKIDSIFNCNKIFYLDSNLCNNLICIDSSKTIIANINPYCGSSFDLFRKLKTLDSIGEVVNSIIVVNKPENLHYELLKELRQIYNLPIYYQDTSRYNFEKHLGVQFINDKNKSIFLFNKDSLINSFIDADSLSFVITNK